VSQPEASRPDASQPVVIATIHPVRDFDVWANIINELEAELGSGVVGRRVYRSLDDPNEVMIVVQMESLDHAKALLPSFGMRSLLDRAGIDIYPPVFLGAEVEDLARRPDSPREVQP
jgi:hypothetical protein